MSIDYRPMWEKLGINMPRHDILMNALPAIGEKLYLPQTSRAKAMASSSA